MSDIATNEVKLVEAALRLQKKKKVLTTAFRAIAELVSEMQADNDPGRVEALLGLHAGVSREDVRMLGKVAKVLEAADKNSFISVMPDTLCLLTQVPDDVRAEAIRCIEAGQPFGKAELERIARYRDWAVSGDEQTAAAARSAFMSLFASRKTPPAIDHLEVMADGLIESIAQFIFDFAPCSPDEGFEVFKERSGYVQAHDRVKAEAATVLAKFEQVLGGPESFNPDGRVAQEALLKRSYDALCRFASGNFAHVGGFAFDEKVEDLFSNELVDAIRHIATQLPDTLEPLIIHSKPPKQLRVLELCAGAGGMAIGLMSAGFSHCALYESMNTRVKTLRDSWPDWPVVHMGIEDIIGASLKTYGEIDLLAAGPPGSPFSRDPNKGGRGSDNDLFPEVMRVINLVRPRAFMIETPPGLSYAPHVAYLADICADAVRLGYRTEVTYLELKDYGLPQNRERGVIIGIRNDEPGSYIPPRLTRTEIRSVAEVLGTLVIRHETPETSKDLGSRDKPQKDYDNWAAAWRRATNERFLKTIPTASKAFDHKDLAGLVAAGFDGSSYAETAPGVIDVTDASFKPKLTLKMIARAQGLPEGWKFRAIGGGNVDMVAEAFPPILAKAVGLSIYSALTGIQFDLDEALASPLIDSNRIGKKRLNLNAEWSIDFKTNEAVELALRNLETVTLDSNAKKRAQQLRKVVAALEPNRKRAPLVRKLLNRAMQKRMHEQIGS